MKLVALLVATLVVGCGGHGTGAGVDSGDDGGGGGGGGGGGDDGGGDDDGGVTDGTMTTDGPPTPACPNWCAEPAPSGTGLLYSVFAIDTGNVLAVGDGGVILQRKNNAWTKMTSNTSANLRGVWAASGTDAWAVGQGGTFMHFTAGAWTAVTVTPSVDINGIWGSGPSDVWAVGPSRVFHYNGTSWSPTTIIGALLAVTGTGPNDVWISGENTYTHHYTGSWATVMPGSGSTDYYAIHAISATNVWATSLVPGKETVNYTGGSPWTPHATSSAVFQSLYGTASDLWGVGGMQAGHWNGTAWTLSTPLNVTQSLWGVHGSGGDIWAVGGGATILHKN